MYCAKCGVKLADTEKVCPLCGTVVFHPDIQREEGQRLYPAGRNPNPQVSRWGVLIIVSTIFLLPMLLTLLCDMQINNSITWSGYVTGALLVGYEICVLPLWFRKPNPVIFVPCGFGAVGVYVLYINWLTGGNWFLSFAFPVIGYVAVVVTTVVTLLRYVRRGELYIFGGAIIAMGALMPLLEFLINLTFDKEKFLMWSFYPLIGLVLLGSMLIFLAVCRPARETMERKFFI